MMGDVARDLEAALGAGPATAPGEEQAEEQQQQQAASGVSEAGAGGVPLGAGAPLSLSDFCITP